jgi:hypothetical protein
LLDRCEESGCDRTRRSLRCRSSHLGNDPTRFGNGCNCGTPSNPDLNPQPRAIHP